MRGKNTFDFGGIGQLSQMRGKSASDFGGIGLLSQMRGKNTSDSGGIRLLSQMRGKNTSDPARSGQAENDGFVPWLFQYFGVHICMLCFFQHSFSSIVLMISFLTRNTKHQTLQKPDTTIRPNSKGRIVDNSWVFN
ncbi:hypothetical protein [Paenibacillus jilunlii]|nr:hypothetical protein [Paenibacillus jilunlii]